MLPLGYRNNNPLNIERGAAWQGLATREEVAAAGIDWSKRYCQFRGPHWGIRAAARILRTYQRDRGIRTVDGVIARWAPKDDANPVENYARFVRQELGVSASFELDLTTWGHAFTLIKAMAHFENGEPWPYQDHLVNIGLELAEVSGVPANFP